mgnify:CR=1 FL=1|jgi:flagellin
MADVSLTAAVRNSLLALQNTTQLIAKTQDRLSTGLRVGSPIDDPVSFFQAKSLNDRASDFNEKRDAIEQGISTVTGALDGVEAVESIVQQMKGIAQSIKAATGTQFTDLITQYNSLRTQINNLTTDAQYQGTNLINGTGTTLKVEFSEKTASVLNIASVDVTNATTGLNIGVVANYTGSFNVSFGAQTIGSAINSGEAVTLTWAGSAKTYTTADGAITFTFGTASVAISVSSGTTQVLAKGDAITLAYNTGAGVLNPTSGGFQVTAAQAVGISATNLAATTVSTNYIAVGDTTAINSIVTGLDTALTTLRSNATTLGSNVALLKTRADFTNAYVNTLEEGAGKLTLADINEEGANLLALQTRQQLGIQSLSFAGQAEQSILALFR